MSASRHASARMVLPLSRPLRIVAQDPSIKSGNRILRAILDVPAEDLERGPWGHRVQVVDYDVSTDRFHPPLPKSRYSAKGNVWPDPFHNISDKEILSNPHFRAQNVYAIVMCTLARFEAALGRPIPWPFEAHQLKVIPQALAEANAYYSRSEEALVFGYFPSVQDESRLVYTSLSHDIIVHETTHALLDAQREYFNAPASKDQAAFHEGFADVVALLSVFSLPGIAEKLLEHSLRRRGRRTRNLLTPEDVTPTRLRRSGLLGLAEEMGRELSGLRANALRDSASLPRSSQYYNNPQKYPEFSQVHRRGEILVAAMLDAFLAIWSSRFPDSGPRRTASFSRRAFVEEGAAVANYLLTMAIRAIDYTPPIFLEYGDYLSALLTADAELRPREVKFPYRYQLVRSFAAWGIRPSSRGSRSNPGVWNREHTTELDYERTHLAQMERDPDEVFEFIWHNADALKVPREAYGRVVSVRPCQRVAPNGAVLHETVCELYQVLKVRASELGPYDVTPPEGMPRDLTVSLRGGCTLIFDEYGRLKYNIHNRLTSSKRQQQRLHYLWHAGFFGRDGEEYPEFSRIHRERAGFPSPQRHPAEEW
jgi:hypothetical protein